MRNEAFLVTHFVIFLNGRNGNRQNLIKKYISLFQNRNSKKIKAFVRLFMVKLSLYA